MFFLGLGMDGSPGGLRYRAPCNANKKSTVSRTEQKKVLATCTQSICWVAGRLGEENVSANSFFEIP